MGWLKKAFGSEEKPVKARTKKPVAKSAAAPARSTTAKPAAPKPAALRPRAAAHVHTSDVKAGQVTVAHDQAMTLHVLSHIPDHQPREDDPHYHLFELAKARLKRQKMWKCMIDDDLCEGQPELHHTYVEFSQINQVDPKDIEKALGLHFDTDEDFQVWVESPGNLEVLCVNHHRAHYGIHVIPGPLWEALRFHKNGSEAPAEFISAADANKQNA
jgi:hypothetical protein